MKKIIIMGFMVTILILGNLVSHDNAYAATNDGSTYQVNWDNLLGGDIGDQFGSVIKTNDGGYIAVGYSFSSARGEIILLGNTFFYTDYC